MSTERAPEWDFFERIEELEEAHDIQELELQDTKVLARWGFLFAFMLGVKGSSNPRKSKDSWVAFLKRRYLTKETLYWLEEEMTHYCDLTEEKRG